MIRLMKCLIIDIIIFYLIETREGAMQFASDCHSGFDGLAQTTNDRHLHPGSFTGFTPTHRFSH